MSREDAHERYARITQEVFEVRWIASLISGAAKDDPRFAHDRKGAEALLRERGWDPIEVAARATQLSQGILEVPRPLKEVQAGPKKRRGVGAIFGGSGSPEKSWEEAVNSWSFLRSHGRGRTPATDEQRRWWSQEARRRLRGQPASPRPWAPDHEDGYGRQGSIPARMAPTAGNVVAGLRVEDLFAASPLAEAERELEEPEWD